MKKKKSKIKSDSLMEGEHFPAYLDKIGVAIDEVGERLGEELERILGVLNTLPLEDHAAAAKRFEDPLALVAKVVSKLCLERAKVKAKDKDIKAEQLSLAFRVDGHGNA